ncbi:MAG: hypothetical protein AAF703_05000 [Cyanobacteria bacterium P01_D01_bin.105]
MKYQKNLVSGAILCLAAGIPFVGSPCIPSALANETASESATIAQTDIEPADIEPADIEPANSAPEIFIEPVPPRTIDAGPSDEMLNLTPEVIEQSPVLQRWIEAVPDIRADIRHDPSFVTRLYAGYSLFPSSDGTSGFVLGVEDVFLADIPLTFSADYQQNIDRNAANRRQSYGADLHYYLLPLGDYFNVAPTLGYRYAESGNDYAVSGMNVGIRLRFVPSRTGAADVTLDQSWIVGDSEGLSITQLNVGYAVTKNLRLSGDLEWQRTADEGDSRVGVNLEWAL